MSPRRDPQGTRQRLLHAAFREFHRSGYFRADLDRVLVEVRVTKGALYHHFSSKKALGFAVIDELLRDWIRDRWLLPLEDARDPVASLRRLAEWGAKSASATALSRGCPLLRLSQELAGVDEGFRLRLAAIYDEWQQGLRRLLSRAQAAGQVRPEVDVEVAAAFIVATWQGATELARASRDKAALERCRAGLDAYLRSLGGEIVLLQFV